MRFIHQLQGFKQLRSWWVIIDKWRSIDDSFAGYYLSFLFCTLGCMRLIRIIRNPYLVGGLVAIFYFPIFWEESSPLTFIFFRGVAQPPTRYGRSSGITLFTLWRRRHHGDLGESLPLAIQLKSCWASTEFSGQSAAPVVEKEMLPAVSFSRSEEICKLLVLLLFQWVLAAALGLICDGVSHHSKNFSSS